VVVVKHEAFRYMPEEWIFTVKKKLVAGENEVVKFNVPRNRLYHITGISTPRSPVEIIMDVDGVIRAVVFPAWRLDLWQTTPVQQPVAKSFRLAFMAPQDVPAFLSRIRVSAARMTALDRYLLARGAGKSVEDALEISRAPIEAAKVVELEAYLKRVERKARAVKSYARVVAKADEEVDAVNIVPLTGCKLVVKQLYVENSYGYDLAVDRDEDVVKLDPECLVLAEEVRMVALERFILTVATTEAVDVVVGVEGYHYPITVIDKVAWDIELDPREEELAEEWQLRRLLQSGVWS